MQNKLQKEMTPTAKPQESTNSLFKWFWKRDKEDNETTWFFENEMKMNKTTIDQYSRNAETNLVALSRYFKH